MGYLNSDGLETQIQYIKSYVEDEMKKHASIPIGHEYFSMNPNVPDGSLPLLGGLYDRSMYADLWDWVQTQTGYLITESAWQALSNTQNGNVPFYSDGDGSTTFRVPSLKCWIKGTDGVETVGTYLDAGLPNITGNLQPDWNGSTGAKASVIADGAFARSKTGDTDYYLYNSAYSSNSNGSYCGNFDASRSSSVYGNADTVQPESIVGMWLVKAYGTVVDTGSIDEQAYIDEKFAQAKQYTDLRVPIGCVQAFAGTTIPNGWLLCDGSAVSRTTYANLYACIGTTYGAGDGSSTFNLPNLVDKFIEGSATAGTEKSAGLPNITGSTDFGNGHAGINTNNYTSTGVFKVGDNTLNAQHVERYASASEPHKYLDFDASLSNQIYGASTTVQPPALTMRYIIKY